MCVWLYKYIYIYITFRKLFWPSNTEETWNMIEILWHFYLKNLKSIIWYLDGIDKQSNHVL